MPVEKTVEELFEEYGKNFSDLNDGVGGTDEYVDYQNNMSKIISEVKSQVGREVVEDLMKVADKGEIEDLRREVERYALSKGIIINK